MHFTEILLSVLLCTAGSATPIGKPPAIIDSRSWPFSSLDNPSSPSSVDVHSLPARRSAMPDGEPPSPAVKTRPRYPPSAEDLPSLISMIAYANNVSVPINSIIALEHYKYRQNFPPEYAIAYDAQRERNRTIDDELDRCMTLKNDCDDLMSHHHRIERGITCVQSRKVGEALYDEEMELVERGYEVFKELKSRSILKRALDGDSLEKVEVPWYCHWIAWTGCDTYPGFCLWWPFTDACKFRDMPAGSDNGIPIVRREVQDMSDTHDHTEKIAAEELAGRIEGHREDRRSVHDRRRPPGPDDENCYLNDPCYFDENGVKRFRGEKAPKKAIPWDIVGQGIVYTPKMDRWGNDLTANCQDTWVEPGVLSESENQQITGRMT